MCGVPCPCMLAAGIALHAALHHSCCHRPSEQRAHASTLPPPPVHGRRQLLVNGQPAPPRQACLCSCCCFNVPPLGCRHIAQRPHPRDCHCQSGDGPIALLHCEWRNVDWDVTRGGRRPAIWPRSPHPIRSAPHRGPLPPPPPLPRGVAKYNEPHPPTHSPSAHPPGQGRHQVPGGPCGGRYRWPQGRHGLAVGLHQ